MVMATELAAAAAITTTAATAATTSTTALIVAKLRLATTAETSSAVVATTSPAGGALAAGPKNLAIGREVTNMTNAGHSPVYSPAYPSWRKMCRSTDSVPASPGRPATLHTYSVRSLYVSRVQYGVHNSRILTTA